MKRRPLSSVSRTRAAERDARSVACEEALRRYGYRCALIAAGRCRNVWGHDWSNGDAVECHEVARRSTVPGSHLDADLILPLCHGCHLLDTSMVVAQTVGIRAPSWVWGQYRHDVVLDELARLRAQYVTDRGGPPAFWLTD